jgi:23S rRNA (cytosine1962-C5)-methyltransferase
MFNPDEYELLDFGAGRKLERFGPWTLDRPSPAAEGVDPRQPQLWTSADVRFERTSADRGRWETARPLAETWTLRHDLLTFELKRTESGQVGLFPEQAANWDWVARQARASARPLKVLNLFAYTGASTLAAAAAGAQVVHVDAAASAVAWARRNAEHSGLSSAPIRWVQEDALAFVRREVRRGNRYDGVILDPPSYGHGPRGQPWKLETGLEQLLTLCGTLTASQAAFMLLTCHSPGYAPSRLAELLSAAIDRPAVSLPLTLATADGRQLPSGAAARWP